jgi:hypothetical protein
MIRILNANLKWFFGAKYERVFRSSFILMIVFIALRSSGFHINIAPSVLALTTTFVTIIAFVVVLQSDDTIEGMRGQLMLPDNQLAFHTAFFTALNAYTLLTKTGLLFVAYIAVSDCTSFGIIVFAVCFIVSGFITYTIAFRSEKRSAVRHQISRTRHSFILYLLRYLTGNKAYLTNTVVLWVFCCVFAITIGMSGFDAVMPLGFALCCLNTPLGVLLSSDKTLYRKVQSLPGQFRTVLLPYAAVVMGSNLIACGLYLVSWQLTAGNVTALMLAIAAFLSTIGAFLTVMLELYFPLLDWKVESDLWHHPRKYVVAGVLMILTVPLMLITI